MLIPKMIYVVRDFIKDIKDADIDVSHHDMFPVNIYTFDTLLQLLCNILTPKIFTKHTFNISCNLMRVLSITGNIEKSKNIKKIRSNTQPSTWNGRLD